MNKKVVLFLLGCSVFAHASSDLETDAVITQLNVLVVEDSAICTKIVEKFLKNSFELATAKKVDMELVVTKVSNCEDGLDEVDKALKNGSGPDVIILDQHLTGEMKGTEFAPRARSKSLEHAQSPFMILNSDDPEAEAVFKKDSEQKDPIFNNSTGKNPKALQEALNKILPVVVERKKSK